MCCPLFDTATTVISSEISDTMEMKIAQQNVISLHCFVSFAMSEEDGVQGEMNGR